MPANSKNALYLYSKIDKVCRLLYEEMKLNYQDRAIDCANWMIEDLIELRSELEK